ncbi:MAG: hypothetical protein AAF081_19290 [Actinomycetota bacterium]
MVDDPLVELGLGEVEVRVADIAITVLEAIETGEARAQAESIASQTELASLSLQRPSGDGGGTAVAVAEPVVAVETEVADEAAPEIQGFAQVDTETDTDEAEPEIVAAAEIEPDDLKVVKGIGPKLEALLHELGIVTYEQVAAFPADYIARLDNYLAFVGRIERDDWVGQAAELAQTRPAKTADLPELPDETPDNATQQD